MLRGGGAESSGQTALAWTGGGERTPRSKMQHKDRRDLLGNRTESGKFGE